MMLSIRVILAILILWTSLKFLVQLFYFKPSYYNTDTRHIFLTPAWLSESEYNIIVHVITILKFTATIFFFVSFSLTRSYKKRVMIQKGLTKRKKRNKCKFSFCVESTNVVYYRNYMKPLTFPVVNEIMG